MIKKNFCVDCGKLIHFRSKRCCSCSIKSRWETGSYKIHYRFGPDHPGWKGGKYTSMGYKTILCPSHPRNHGKRGYVFEHILVWEQTHGKYLPQGWIIHHLNGIKSDNRSINLTALPNHKHFLVLAAKAKRIQELEALLNNQHQLL